MRYNPADVAKVGAELAAKGDPEAIKRLAELQKELSASAHEALATARDREREVSSAIATLAGVCRSRSSRWSATPTPANRPCSIG